MVKRLIIVLSSILLSLELIAQNNDTTNSSTDTINNGSRPQRRRTSTTPPSTSASSDTAINPPSTSTSSGIATKPPAGSTSSGSTDPDTDSSNNDQEKTWQDQFNVLASYNFIGNNKGLSNLTPIIHLGSEYPLYSIDKFVWALDVDPYIGSQIDTDDSVSLVPAMMLPGNGGLLLNNYLKFGLGGGSEFTIAPFNFGIKFLSNFFDSGNLIIQQNIRMGAALRFKEDFMFGIQFTQGWHNLSSESERFYRKVFNRTKTNISYVNITLQAKINSSPLEGSNDEDTKKNTYAYFEWRSLLSKDDYPGFTNNRLFTIGLRRDFGLRNVFYGKGRQGRQDGTQR